MAVAAFKSSSRRPTSSSTAAALDKDTKKVPSPPRRSRSVSALSRSQFLETSPPSSSSSDFLIKRDNPLYWSSSVSPPDKDRDPQENVPTNPKTSNGDNRRGRLASRDADAVKNVAGIGRRSLSRVDTGRRGRSVSRGPGGRGHFVNSESDAEQEGAVLMKYRNRNDSNHVSNVGRKSDLSRSTSGMNTQVKSLRTRSNGSTTNSPSSPTLSCKDGVLGSSFSEAEERTIKAVFEQMKSYESDNVGGDTSNHIYETVRSEVRRAILDIQNDLESAIRRSNATSIATANVTDIPPDLVNPSAVELVLDIRREYANKLEQSQERARKLRADLEVEEHRGLELSRILKEVLPDPKTSNGQKSRPGRKTSIERRKMSKRLTEEAFAYFDECVSLSTFDSSDFSSPEDPPINLVGPSVPVGNHSSFSQGNSGCAANCSPIVKQDLATIASYDASVQSTTGSSKVPALDEVSLSGPETQWGWRSQFSFAPEPNNAFEVQQDIRKYARNFEREIQKDKISSLGLRSKQHDMDEYALWASPESMLSDRVDFKSRMESGSVLLCDGGIAVSSTPFAFLS